MAKKGESQRHNNITMRMRRGLQATRIAGSLHFPIWDHLFFPFFSFQFKAWRKHFPLLLILRFLRAGFAWGGWSESIKRRSEAAHCAWEKDMDISLGVGVGVGIGIGQIYPMLFARKVVGFLIDRSLSIHFYAA